MLKCQYMKSWKALPCIVLWRSIMRSRGHDGCLVLAFGDEVNAREENLKLDLQGSFIMTNVLKPIEEILKVTEEMDLVEEEIVSYNNSTYILSALFVPSFVNFV